MSLLSYLDLCDLVDQGVITGLEDTDQINASSIDVRLGDILICEHPNDRYNIVDPHLRNNFNSYRVNLAEGPYQLAPGQFVLASTVEVFNLPMDISADFILKSSGARSGLTNALAGHCDPGWNGSALTLELKNYLEHHYIQLTRGMRIGQMRFHKHDKAVPHARSYAARGRYNGDKQVSEVKP